MPVFGIGIHVIVALFFAIHAIRRRHEMYWLFVLFAFPALGSIVYFFAIYLPDSRLERGVMRTMTNAVKALDPGREMREARTAFEMTPTAQNQMRLAGALLEAGEVQEAVRHYDACLKGPFASDAEIRIGAAQARMLAGDAAGACDLLEAVRRDNRDYRAERVALLLGQAYAEAGRVDDARYELAGAVQRYGSIEARAEYAIWAVGSGELDVARDQYAEIQKAMKHWNRHTRDLNRPLLRRLESALGGVKA